MTNTDVVNKLIGEIKPYGSTHIDRYRFENLKRMCALVKDLVDDIKEVSTMKNRLEFSVSEMGKYANNFLSDINIKIDKYPDTEADGVVFCGKCSKVK